MTPGRRTRRLFAAAALMIPCVGFVRAETGNLADVERRLEAVRTRITELDGESDFADTLYARWSHRPYARATLAVAIETLRAIQEFIHQERRVDAAGDVAELSSAVAWLEEATARVGNAARDKVPWPGTNTIAEARGGFLAMEIPSATDVLCGFVVDWSMRETRNPFDTLNLVASLGQRFVAASSDAHVAEEQARTWVERAHALGLSTFVVRDPTIEPTDSAADDLTMMGFDAVVEPRPLSDWVEASPTLPACRARIRRGRSARGVPGTGELPASSVARIGLTRTQTEGGWTAAIGWRPVPRASRTLPEMSRAAMWLFAAEGQRFALWGDRFEFDSPSHPGVRADELVGRAELTEAIAHASLDLRRLAAQLPAPGRPRVAIRVQAEALDSADPDSWASWIVPVWTGLQRRQIRFEVLGANGIGESPDAMGDYPVGIELSAARRADPSAIVARIEARLALDPKHVERLTAREIDGRIAADVYAVMGDAPDGGISVILINLTSDSRTIRLRGGMTLPGLRDLLSGEVLREASADLPLAPWQVRLLRP